MKLRRIKIKNIVNFFKELPGILAKKAFLTFLVLLFFTFIFSAYVFYQYVSLEEPLSETGGKEKPIEFKQAVYQEILKIWQERGNNFQGTNSKKYPNLFTEKGKEVTVPKKEPEPEEESEKEAVPEVLPPDAEKLLAAETLTDFYLLRDGRFPSEAERAAIWEAKGLGPSWQYYGSKSQNQILLQTLKEELTP